MKYSENVCNFIPHHTETQALHTVHFVLETEPQDYPSLRAETLHKVFYVCEGSGFYHTLNGEKHRLTAGDLFFSFLGTPYALTSDRDFQYLYISFVGERANLLLRSLDISQDRFIFHDCGSVGSFWEDAIGMKNTFQDLLSESVLLYTFAVLREKHIPGQQEVSCADSFSERVKTFIDRNYSDPGLSLDSVSEALSYSRNYISQKFRSSMGISIAEYIQTVRIQNACSMMQNGITSVGMISYSCGYRDSLYFSRVFRKKIGESPREFIKSISEKTKKN